MQPEFSSNHASPDFNVQYAAIPKKVLKIQETITLVSSKWAKICRVNPIGQYRLIKVLMICLKHTLLLKVINNFQDPANLTCISYG